MDTISTDVSGNVWKEMDVNMSDLNEFHKNLHEANNKLWEVIRDLHEMDCMKEMKEKLILVSGELCSEIIIPLERKIEKLPQSPDDQ